MISQQLESLVKERGRELRDLAEDQMVRAVIEAAPDGPARDEGGEKLRDSVRSIQYERGDSVFGTIIEVSAPHAEYVSKGTRPHRIEPRQAKVLRFEVDGQIVFARFVEHPGTEANPYFENTTQTWPDVLRDVQ